MEKPALATAEVDGSALYARSLSQPAAKRRRRDSVVIVEGRTQSVVTGGTDRPVASFAGTARRTASAVHAALIAVFY